jgi:PAS domain S-box-containing protein
MDKKKILNIFKASPTPTSIIDVDSPHFSFLNFNDAYSELNQLSGDNLVGKSIFEAFPENPEEDKPTGVQRLKASFKKVLKTKKSDELGKIRYDIKGQHKQYRKEYWNVTNTPVFDDHGEVEAIINTAINITEQVKSEQENQIMLNKSQSSFILLNDKLVIQNFNDVFAARYKKFFQQEVKKNISILEYIPPQDREEAKKRFERVLEGESIEREVVYDTPAVQQCIMITYKPIRDENGVVTGVFESILDKTEEYITKNELKENEARFRTLVEHGNDVVFILTAEGSPKYVSPSIENVLGYSIEEAKEFDVAGIVHPEDQQLVIKELGKSLSEPGVPISVPPARMKHKNGTWRWFDGTITNMLDDPRIGGIVDNFKDITERVKAEQKLNETKELYQSLIQTIEGVVWEGKAETLHFTFVSSKSKSMFGYDPQEWIDDPEIWVNNIHPDDRQEAYNYCLQETEKGQNHDFEYRFRKASGEYIWVRDVVTVISKDGKPELLRGLMIDITEQKKLINLMEETYKIAKIGNWEIDVEEWEIFLSPYIKQLHEVPKSYTASLDEVLQFFDGEDSQQLMAGKIENAIKKGISFDVTLPIKTAKDNDKWVRVVGTPDLINERCVRVFGSTQDITEQKLMREDLQKAEEKYRNVVEHSTNMFYTHDTNGVLTYVSPQSEHFLGYTPEEAKKRWVEFITDHPVNAKGIKVTQKAIETGVNQPPYELQLRTTKGEIIWVEVNEAPFVVDGKTHSIVGSLTDITERKKYESQLKESLKRYHYVSKATRDAIYDWDAKTNFVHWEDGLTTLFGHQPKDIDTVDRWLDLIHPDDLEDVNKSLQYRLEDTNSNHWAWKYRLKKDDGNYAHVNENGYIIRNKEGKNIRMIGTIQDITEDVKNKEEIQNSLTEKETLLSEIHHRVKNNLAVVSGMMQLQAFESNDNSLQNKLYDSVVRIKTMATVHELLYQSQSFSQLEFSETLQKLVENISDTLQTSNEIETTINCDPLKLNINQAIPASLIVNEVVTNIYKHAFRANESGKINFELFEEEDLITIRIEDNGMGFETDSSEESSSLGLHLINVLSDQINATNVYRNKKEGRGAYFELQFQRSRVHTGIGNSSVH